jgi:hypothetical protein
MSRGLSRQQVAILDVMSGQLSNGSPVVMTVEDICRRLGMVKTLSSAQRLDRQRWGLTDKAELIFGYKRFIVYRALRSLETRGLVSYRGKLGHEGYWSKTTQGTAAPRSSWPGC